ncbi:MAG: hypothetical protein EA374_01415 [Acholeplasmatales bacterium]|nr:MAG: hypothetical protein EA374_01415 [Acholeplasmatales bacterium]
MSHRFAANAGILSAETLAAIQAVHVLIVGLGGLGGHVANSLVRLGVRRLTLVDPDVFEVSNLNRQLFSDRHSLGKPKAEVVADALRRLDETIDVTVHVCDVEDLDATVFTGVDWMIDAVDQIDVKLWIEQLARRLGVLYVHGAIGGWYGQFAVCRPGADVLKQLYGAQRSGLETTLLSPTFTPAIVANLMVAEWVKCMGNHPQSRYNTVFVVDTASQMVEILYQDSEEDGSW